MLRQKTLKYSGQLFEFTKDGLSAFAKIFLRKVFDIREGEITKVLLMFFNIFLLISTILILKPVVNSLFLSRFGAESLPYAFVLVALFATVVSFVYSKTLKTVPLNKIIIRTQVFSILMFLIFWFLLFFQIAEGWELFLFYIWVAIFSVLSASQFWILANIIFNSREAKRLFGFIGAGAIAGGIFGGYLTSVLVYFIRSENMILVAVFLISLCIVITVKIWKIFGEEVQTTFQAKKRFNGFTDHPFILIKNSKHLTYLASIIGVGVIVAKLVDYQFSAIASEQISDSDSLTAFFGFWFSNMNLISLFIQLFLTRRVVGVFGVGTSLFFLPAGILLGTIAILFAPELWAVIFLRINEGSLKQSVNKAGIELLALPIPSEIKSQTKSFIDVIVDSIASGLGGLMLLVLVVVLGASTQFISLLILLHIVLWFYLVVKIRKEYIKLFMLKINQNKDKTNKNLQDLNNKSVVEGLIKVLESGSEQQILYILGKLKEIQNPIFFEPMVKLLNNPSALIRLEVLKNIYFYENNAKERVSKLIYDSNQDVKIAAFEYLYKHYGIDSIDKIRPFLANEDSSIKLAAILSLAGEARNNFVLKKDIGFKKILDEYLVNINKAVDTDEQDLLTISLIKIIGLANIKSYYGEIYKALESTSKSVKTQAIISAGTTTDPQFIDKLIQFISEDDYEEVTKKALLLYGPQIIDILFNKVHDKSIDVEKRKLLTSLMERVGVQKSVDYLFELVDFNDLVIRNESIKSLNNLKKNFINLKFKRKYVVQKIFDEARLYHDTLAVLYAQLSLYPYKLGDELNGLKKLEARKSLINLLERRLDGNLERIFRLLGLRYQLDEMLIVFHGIKDSMEDIRANSIEFMDNLLEPNLKKIILPIIEVATLNTITEEAITNLKLKIPSEIECLEVLLQGRDLKIKLAVLFLITELKDSKYIPILQKYIDSDDLKIRTFATKALESIKDKAFTK